MNEGFDEKSSTVDSRLYDINLMDVRGDFTQANSILSMKNLSVFSLKVGFFLSSR